MNVEGTRLAAGLLDFAARALELHCDLAHDSDLAGPWPDLARDMARLRSDPADEDEALIHLAAQLGLSDGELAAVALCLASDSEPHFARLVGQAQEPVGGSRPLVGLACTLFGLLGLAPQVLAGGAAIRSGLLALGDEPRALPERSLLVPLAIGAALAGEFSPPAGITALHARDVAFTTAQRTRLEQEAAWLDQAGDEPRLFVLRTPSRCEGLAGIAYLAEQLDLAPVLLCAEEVGPNAVWLASARALPCIEVSLAPGENKPVPASEFYNGPIVCLAGKDGSVDSSMARREWTVLLPAENERELLWQAAGLAGESASRAAQSYRQGAGRISELADQARNAASDGAFDWEGVSRAVRTGRTALDGLAHAIVANIGRDELVLPEDEFAHLQLLLGRILHRGNLARDLGAAIQPRYGPGVRALFAGEPGTGKTLAAHWLAGESGLPLYRVDLASLTSKWIGETEKNLSAVLDAAQHADVILFFDEADALFGKRTDVSDSNDRHANAQTNYLLQRIEDFEGIVFLATNVRDNMDSAFARRLDMVLQFPMPDPAARFALWRNHLGDAHALSEDQLGALSVGVELAGGHIRNVVLAAAVRARLAEGPITMEHLLAALDDEYSKLGRSAPVIGA